MNNLKEYFLNQLKNNDIYLTLASGKAKYKMNKGSFTTSDKISDKHKLIFKENIDNKYIFSDGNVSVDVIVNDLNDRFELTFFTKSNYNRFSLRFKSFEDEYIYGCGEQYTHFNLKNQKVDIWVSEHQQAFKMAKKFLREKLFGVNPGYKAKYKEHQTYYSSPSFTSSKNYYVHLNTTSFGRIYFNKDETVLSFREIINKITFIFADNPLALNQKVCNFIGIMPRLPDYTNDGLIMASQGGSEKLLQRYKYLKEKGVKVAGIWCQDWSGQIVTKFGTQVYWNWSLDSKLYSNFNNLLETLNKDNVKFLGYINTFLKENTTLYNYAKEHDYLVKKSDGSIYLIKSTTFDAGIIDLTYKEAYEWYKKVIKENMIGVGLSGWMADFGEYLPTDAVVKGGDAEKLHNIWPTLWAKCNYEALKETNSIGKIFIFNRSAYTDSIKYTTSMWNGDQHVDFSDEYGLGSVVPATLSMAMCGVGVNHSDVGGYTTILHMKRSKELMIRWAAFNIFTPVFRCHEGNRPQCNVQSYQEDVVEWFKYFADIFVALKSYRKDVLEEYYQNGYPVNRPLFFHFNEKECYSIQNEFLFGSELLCLPVSRPNVTSIDVYLPNGDWVDIITGKEYKGGYVNVDAPLGKPIAFYLKGGKHEYIFKNIKEIKK